MVLNMLYRTMLKCGTSLVFVVNLWGSVDFKTVSLRLFSCGFLLVYSFSKEVCSRGI